MRELNLITNGTYAEIILEQFDLDTKRGVLTVIDDEQNPSTVTFSREEATELSQWLKEFLEATR